MRRAFSVFNAAARRSSSLRDSSRFRSLSVFLFSRRTGRLCETFADDVSTLSLSLAPGDGTAHSLSHAVYTEHSTHQNPMKRTQNTSFDLASDGGCFGSVGHIKKAMQRRSRLVIFITNRDRLIISYSSHRLDTFTDNLIELHKVTLHNTKL